MGHPSAAKKNVISASEVGQYSYCSVAWLLQRRGFLPDSPALGQGRQTHEAMGSTLEKVRHEERRASVALAAGILILAGVVLALVVGW